MSASKAKKARSELHNPIHNSTLVDLLDFACARSSDNDKAILQTAALKWAKSARDAIGTTLEAVQTAGTDEDEDAAWARKLETYKLTIHVPRTAWIPPNLNPQTKEAGGPDQAAAREVWQLIITNNRPCPAENPTLMGMVSLMVTFLTTTESKYMLYYQDKVTLKEGTLDSVLARMETPDANHTRPRPDVFYLQAMFNPVLSFNSEVKDDEVAEWTNPDGNYADAMLRAGLNEDLQYATDMGVEDAEQALGERIDDNWDEIYVVGNTIEYVTSSEFKGYLQQGAAAVVFRRSFVAAFLTWLLGPPPGEGKDEDEEDEGEDEEEKEEDEDEGEQMAGADDDALLRFMHTKATWVVAALPTRIGGSTIIKAGDTHRVAKDDSGVNYAVVTETAYCTYAAGKSTSHASAFTDRAVFEA